MPLDRADRGKILRVSAAIRRGNGARSRKVVGIRRGEQERGAGASDRGARPEKGRTGEEPSAPQVDGAGRELAG
jgi:hypothetical protein